MKNFLFTLIANLIFIGFIQAQESTQIDPKFIGLPRFADLVAIQASISSPVNGMMVYNNGTQSFWFYNGTWNNLSAAASGSQWTSSGANISNTNSGNIGIGTLTPTSKLNVNGQVTIDQKNFGGYGGLLIKGDKVASNYPNIVFSLNNSNSADINAAYIGGDIENHTAGTEAMGITFLTSTGGGGLTERMRIKGNGNIGIGTNNPTTAKLVIGGSVGQEGIDLSSNDIYANMRVIRNSNFGLDKDMFFGFGSGPTSTLHLYSNNVETATIKNGKVGIGNANPQLPLQFANTLGTKISLFQGANGHVGIGVHGGELRLQNDIPTGKVSLGVLESNGSFTELVKATKDAGSSLTVNGKIKVIDGSQGTNNLLTSDANGVSTWKTASQIIQNFSVMSPMFTIPDNQPNNIPGTSITFTAPTTGRIVIFPRVETRYACINPLDHCYLYWEFIPKINGSAIFTNNQQGVSRYQQVIAYVAPTEDRTLGPYVINVSPGTHTISFDIKLNTITPAPAIVLNAYVQFIPN